MNEFILAHDLGTSQHKAILTTARGELLATACAPLQVHTPREGWAEQSPHAWWEAVQRTTRAVLAQAGIAAAQVRMLAFTGQVQTTLPVDARGEPLCAALTWLDARAAQESRHAMRGALRVQGYGVRRLLTWLYHTNGAPSLSGRDSVARMLWLRAHRPDLWQRVHKVLDARDYLLLRCTGRYVTSHDAAHLTWLMDVRRLAWCPSLLRLLNLDVRLLPTLVPAQSIVGGLTPQAAAELGLVPGTPVLAGASDFACLAVGTGAVEHNAVSVGLGTSAWVATHVPQHCNSVTRYTASVTSAWPDRPLLVAHQELGGACARWLVQTLRSGQLQAPRTPDAADYAWLQAAAQQTVPGAEGLLFTPWLAGEYAPVHDAAARGSFFGLTLQHRAAHLARAVLEGVACNVRWALQSVAHLARGARSGPLYVGGGGALSAAWCQIIADVCQRPVHQSESPKFATARGAALLAAQAMGAVGAHDAMAQVRSGARCFSPNPALRGLYDARFAQLRQMYRHTRSLGRLGTVAGAELPETAQHAAPQTASQVSHNGSGQRLA